MSGRGAKRVRTSPTNEKIRLSGGEAHRNHSSLAVSIARRLVWHNKST